MGRFVVSVLDFLCVTAIVVISIAAFFVGGQMAGPAASFQMNFALLYAAGAFLIGTVVFGAVLAITEIAKNTRKMIKLLEHNQRTVRAEPTVR